jgi:hypothetical protein
LVVGILGVNGSIQDGAVLVTDAVLRSFHGVAALSRENIYALDRFLKGPGIPNRLPVRLAPPVFVASIHPPAEWINLPLAAVGRNSHQVFVSDGGVGIMFSFGVHSRSGRVFLMEWQTCKLQKSASDSSDD